MAEQDQSPVFQIQRIYLKDLSLEQPNSPQVLLEQTQPQVDIQLGMAAEVVTPGIFEVTVTGTVTTKVGDKVLFLVEAKQAGIFRSATSRAGSPRPSGVTYTPILRPHSRCR